MLLWVLIRLDSWTPTSSEIHVFFTKQVQLSKEKRNPFYLSSRAGNNFLPWVKYLYKLPWIWAEWIERTILVSWATGNSALSERGKGAGHFTCHVFRDSKCVIHWPPFSLSMPRADITNWSWHSFPLSQEAALKTPKTKFQAAAYYWSFLV